MCRVPQHKHQCVPKKPTRFFKFLFPNALLGGAGQIYVAIPDLVHYSILSLPSTVSWLCAVAAAVWQ